jgi:hypothetical protein
VATIIDDDGEPSLSVQDVTVTEGNSGTVDATFTVTLAPTSGRVVTVDYSTATGTAQAPDDYQAASGTLTFQPGEGRVLTKTVTVPVGGDTIFEPDETFLFSLANATNATIGDSLALGTILNDDTAPPPPPPPPPPPGPPPPPPPTTCRVPRVIGKTLVRARQLITAAGCRTGRVRRARSAKKIGIVIGQRPGPNRVVATGTLIQLVVSKGIRNNPR